jgi:Spy/CpxP family protein refolding chaperone
MQFPEDAMKKMMCCGLLMMGLVGATAFAQTAPAPAPAPDAAPAAAPAARTPPSPEKVVALMTAKLNLTPDQAAKITPIIADRQQQMQALRADTSSRPMQRMKKAKAVGEAADAKINAILTPDQQKQYAAMEEQMKEQMKERREEQKNGVY